MFATHKEPSLLISQAASCSLATLTYTFYSLGPDAQPLIYISTFLESSGAPFWVSASAPHNETLWNLPPGVCSAPSIPLKIMPQASGVVGRWKGHSGSQRAGTEVRDMAKKKNSDSEDAV